MAAPLRIVASTTGALVVSVWSDIRQCSRLALTARLGYPPVDNAGGAAWFPWEKNRSRSPLRD